MKREWQEFFGSANERLRTRVRMGHYRFHAIAHRLPASVGRIHTQLYRPYFVRACAQIDIESERR